MIVYNPTDGTPFSGSIPSRPRHCFLMTQANIYYELGIAQAMGKETVIVKSPGAEVPSDFVRTEYILFEEGFETRFDTYLLSIFDQADYYETLGDQLDRDPILAIDYYKRAYLINGDKNLKRKVSSLLKTSGLEERATNSVEHIAASF